jgi:hypothetical protein
MLQQYSACSESLKAVYFVVRHNRLQVTSCKGVVLRGFTSHPLSSHASGMATRLLAFLHLISVRTELVRTECYYIWYWKASKPLHLGLSEKTGEIDDVLSKNR